MLRAAKHLLFLIENKQKQILRSAQDDMLGGFFSSLLGFPHSLCRPVGRSSCDQKVSRGLTKNQQLA